MNDAVVITATTADQVELKPSDRVVTPAQAEKALEELLETAETIVISEDHSTDMGQEVK